MVNGKKVVIIKGISRIRKSHILSASPEIHLRELNGIKMIIIVTYSKSFFVKIKCVSRLINNLLAHFSIILSLNLMQYDVIISHYGKLAESQPWRPLFQVLHNNAKLSPCL